MGRKIYKQPNGKYCVWSTVVDDFIYMDCTRDELVDFYVEDRRRSIAFDIDTEIQRINGELPKIRGFAPETLEEAMETIGDIHGEEERKKRVKEFLCTGYKEPE